MDLLSQVLKGTQDKLNFECRTLFAISEGSYTLHCLDLDFYVNIARLDLDLVVVFSSQDSRSLHRSKLSLNLRKDDDFTSLPLSPLDLESR